MTHTSNDYCTFHPVPFPFEGRTVGINKGGLYVIPSGNGYSTLGFHVAEQKRRAVLAWLGKGWLHCEPGTPLAYSAYLEAMKVGADHAAKTGTRCNVDLTPELIGLEGKRVEVISPGERPRRFYVGKSTGWMPIHLEIARRNSSGGLSAYIPKGATVRVVGTR